MMADLGIVVAFNSSELKLSRLRLHIVINYIVSGGLCWCLKCDHVGSWDQCARESVARCSVSTLITPHIVCMCVLMCNFVSYFVCVILCIFVFLCDILLPSGVINDDYLTIVVRTFALKNEGVPQLRPCTVVAVQKEVLVDIPSHNYFTFFLPVVWWIKMFIIIHTYALFIIRLLALFIEWSGHIYQPR